MSNDINGLVILYRVSSVYRLVSYQKGSHIPGVPGVDEARGPSVFESHTHLSTTSCYKGDMMNLQDCIRGAGYSLRRGGDGFDAYIDGDYRMICVYTPVGDTKRLTIGGVSKELRSLLKKNEHNTR